MAYNDIKYICFDLDGTLLSNNKTISNDILTVLHELHDVRFNYILISSRHIEDIIPFSKQLRFTERDFIISCDGEYVYQKNGDLVLKNKMHSSSDTALLFESNSCNKMMIIGQKKDYYVVNNILHRIYINLRSYKNSRLIAIHPNQIRKIDDDIEKIVFCTTLNDKAINAYKNNYVIHKTKEGKVEVLPEGISKYHALKSLSEILGLELDKFMFFGDDYNDEECFDNLKYTIAMGNAPEEIKLKAFFVTKTNENRGILYALDSIFHSGD